MSYIIHKLWNEIVRKNMIKTKFDLGCKKIILSLKLCVQLIKIMLIILERSKLKIF